MLRDDVEDKDAMMYEGSTPEDRDVARSDTFVDCERNMKVAATFLGAVDSWLCTFRRLDRSSSCNTIFRRHIYSVLPAA